jgi:HAD superfamily hydrolase (TIGR01509 family)
MTPEALLAGRTHTLHLVIFDCDGVLVDSETIARRVVAEALTTLGWHLTPIEAHETFVGMSLDTMLPIIAARIGRPVPGSWIDDLKSSAGRALAEELTPVPGAIEALDGITALGLPWRVASNSSHPEMRVKFARTGLTDRVAGRIHSYTDVAQGKPAPDLFLSAAAAEGVPPENCIVIEDSPTGARAAAAAGMDCLGYAPHGADEALRATGAVLFRSMFDLPGLIGLAPRELV